MLMKSTIVTAAIIVFAQSSFAKDLPDATITKKRASYVSIYDVNTAKITNFKYTPASQTSVAKMSGLVQIELSVEGNICGASPSTLAVALKYKNDTTDVALLTSSAYNPNPEIMTACLAYSKGSIVTAPIAIDDYIFTGRSNTPHKFVIEIDNSNKKLVTVTVNTSSHTYDVAISDLL